MILNFNLASFKQRTCLLSSVLRLLLGLLKEDLRLKNLVLKGVSVSPTYVWAGMLSTFVNVAW